MTLTSNNVITLRKLTLKVTAEKGIHPVTALSKPVMNLTTGIWVGLPAKFIPFCITESSGSVSTLSDMFTTHRSVTSLRSLSLTRTNGRFWLPLFSCFSLADTRWNLLCWRDLYLSYSDLDACATQSFTSVYTSLGNKWSAAVRRCQKFDFFFFFFFFFYRIKSRIDLSYPFTH